MRRLHPSWVAMCAGLLLVFGGHALALINPNFTPNHLVKQAGSILVVKFGKEADGKIPMQVIRDLKGKPPAESLALDIKNCAIKEQAASVRELVASVGETGALLFVGDFKEEGGAKAGGVEGSGATPEAFIHLSGKWIGLFRDDKDKGLLVLDKLNTHMEGTFDGGTDMFIRMIEFIQGEDDRVPCTEEVKWIEEKKLAKVEGKVAALSVVDLGGKGEVFLYVASDSGDRLIKVDRAGKPFSDATAARKLGARSAASAWGDFDADGRLDLASWDGKKLSLWQQGQDGAFAAVEAKIAPAAPGDIVGLDALDVGAKSAGLLVSVAKGAPVVLVPKEAGAFEARALEAKGDSAGGRKCLVADFDGDGICDVIQPFEKSSLYFKGQAPGKFAPGAACAVFAGKGFSGLILGDYDQDGLLDIWGVSEDFPTVWQNRGGGKFEETWGQTGESGHIAQPGGVGGCSGDINNDGRQDILLVYGSAASERRPLIFFNRGFRSTGHAHKVDLSENQAELAKELFPEEPAVGALSGQQAGLLADLDGDGAQEMVLALYNGELWVFRRGFLNDNNELTDEASLCLNVALAPGLHGPLAVTAWKGGRCLGAWNITPGASAFIGVRGAAQITLKWKLPDGKQQQQSDDKTTVEGRPVRFVIPAGK